MDELLAWIYPNRIAIAIATVAIVGIVLIVGWRRGWHRVARHHPRATSLGVVAALALGLPAGWYLGSPLILRTELVEAPPVVAASVPSRSPQASLALGSSAASTALATAQATVAPSPAPSLVALRGR